MCHDRCGNLGHAASAQCRLEIPGRFRAAGCSVLRLGQNRHVPSSRWRYSATSSEARAPLDPSCLRSRLTIVGGVRERVVVARRGRLGTVCARGACPTWSCGPSTSPLGASGDARHDTWRCGLLRSSNHTLSGAARHALPSSGRIPTPRSSELSSAVCCDCVRASFPVDSFCIPVVERQWYANLLDVVCDLRARTSSSMCTYVVGHSVTLPVLRCFGGGGSPRERLCRSA